MQTHTYLVYLQGTLPHSKEVRTAHFLSLWELHWGQDILRSERQTGSRQTDRQTHPSYRHSELSEADHCFSHGKILFRFIKAKV